MCFFIRKYKNEYFSSTLKLLIRIAIFLTLFNKVEKKFHFSWSLCVSVCTFISVTNPRKILIYGIQVRYGLFLILKIPSVILEIGVHKRVQKNSDVLRFMYGISFKYIVTYFCWTKQNMLTFFRCI